MANQADERTSRIGGDGSAGRGELLAVGLGAALVLAAVLVGISLNRLGISVHASAAPLFAHFDPHVGVGTPFALLTAVLVVRFGPGIAAGWSWPAALTAATLAGLLWTVSLALVGGVEGILGPLAGPHEYLVDVPRAVSSTDLLRTFAASIPADSAMPWQTHTSGHPPAMLLFFALAARVGLAGAGPAAALCLLAAALIVPGVAVTTRMVCGEDWARRALPFGVLLPAVIWAGVSADAVIAATGVLGLLLLAIATTGAPSPGPTSPGPTSPGAATMRAAGAGLAGGLVLGLACFLSYGAILLAVPAAALLIARRRWWLGPWVGVGGLIVVAAFALSGFAWWDGLAALSGRYGAGYGGTRPFGYWSWADLAALTIAAGPGVVAGLARLLPVNRPDRPARPAVPAGALALAGGALVAVVLAALTGMSKGEVERIWLPWIVWLPLACAALPRSRARWWLVAQAVVALLVEHLLITPW